MILGLFAFAWVPIFIADFVRLARPDLAASSIPQGYGKQWLGVTAVFSGFGVMAAFVHAVRFVIWLVRPAKIIQTHVENTDTDIAAERHRLGAIDDARSTGSRPR